MHPSEGFPQASEAECWACRTPNRMPEEEYAIVKVPLLVVLLAQQGTPRLRASGRSLVCSVGGAAASFLPKHMDWRTAAHGESSNLPVSENTQYPFHRYAVDSLVQCRKPSTDYQKFVPPGAAVFILIVTLVAVHFLLNPLLGDSPWYFCHCIWSVFLVSNIILHFAGATLLSPGEAVQPCFRHT